MPNIIKTDFLSEVQDKAGKPLKLPRSQSLFDIGDNAIRLYIRYSKLHKRNQAFYGLRKEDLTQLAGRNSIICFLWDNQMEPLFIPFDEFEDVFDSIEPASDGQYKVQIYVLQNGIELYIANAGRFNVESFLGWGFFEKIISKNRIMEYPEFTHSQIQSIIGSIGQKKGFDIWIPLSDRSRLDWKYAYKFSCKEDLPQRYGNILNVINEIDIIWIMRGSSEIGALFEVEHSTPIYSGLLRFNDLHLTDPLFKPRFNIVSNTSKKSLFLKQVRRPTFKMSGLLDVCNFMDYKDIYRWYIRLMKG